MAKKVYDFRGRQSGIFRLWGFYPDGFAHALFYRILLIIAPVYAALLLLSLPFAQLGLTVKAFTILVWILITPQLFQALKVPPLTATHGAVFGRFSDAYTYLLSKKRKAYYPIYRAMPYVAMVVWVVLFASMLVWWPI
ncbi:MAG: hypothetical protein ACREBH_02155 [Candidatus Micrarchaeaceae archaeon]